MHEENKRKYQRKETYQNDRKQEIEIYINNNNSTKQQIVIVNS